MLLCQIIYTLLSVFPINTRRTQLLWQVLDSAHVQALVSTKPAVIEVGKMGKRPVQESGHQVAETKV